MGRAYITGIEHMESLMEDKAVLVGLINEALKEDPEIFLDVLRDMIEASGGVGPMAKKSGLSRQALYKMYGGQAPNWSSLQRIFASLGLAPAVQASHKA